MVSSENSSNVSSTTVSLVCSLRPNQHMSTNYRPATNFSLVKSIIVQSPNLMAICSSYLFVKLKNWLPLHATPCQGLARTLVQHSMLSYFNKLVE
ncbi:hypothetical protein BpHYR1_019302 [Brachionus plicatilis]|uniref:Uncharacterized protein n=1 Tax=Brachionus plicatilis TaxID=10195 RepID=A0A3M7RHG2_BRAPC|nr:hypothetical protein BpHYR1_019302 [Brachionus plicatilis]